MKKNDQMINLKLMRAASLCVVIVFTGLSALCAQSPQMKSIETQLQRIKRVANEAMPNELRATVPPGADAYAWDSLLMYVHGTNKLEGKFINREFDNKGYVLTTDVYVYVDGVEQRVREEMKYGFNYPYFHTSFENMRLLEVKQTAYISILTLVTVVEQKWDSNGLMTAFNVLDKTFGISNQYFSVVSKADANKRVISEERQCTNCIGVYHNEYYEYGSHGKVSKLTMKTGTGQANSDVTRTTNYTYNAKKLITEVVDNCETADEKYIEKCVYNYNAQDKLVRVDYFTDRYTGILKQTYVAYFYYKGVTENERIVKNDITVYPNPTSGEIHVSNVQSEIGGVAVYNVLGQWVATVQSGDGSLSATPLNISHLPTGVYFLQIQTSTGVVTKRVVKQ